MSFTKTVPLGVPSVFQISLPCAKSTARKYKVPLIKKNESALLLLGKTLASAYKRVPALVPSVIQVSKPCSPSVAEKTAVVPSDTRLLGSEPVCGLISRLLVTPVTELQLNISVLSRESFDENTTRFPTTPGLPTLSGVLISSACVPATVPSDTPYTQLLQVQYWNRMPSPTTDTPENGVPPAPTTKSLSRKVPAIVPSVTQSSVPCVPSSAVKYTFDGVAATKVGELPLLPGYRSPKKNVPAVVPLVTAGSHPPVGFCKAMINRLPNSIFCPLHCS